MGRQYVDSIPSLPSRLPLKTSECLYAAAHRRLNCETLELRISLEIIHPGFYGKEAESTGHSSAGWALHPQLECAGLSGHIA
jgi:hypothetical protein